MTGEEKIRALETLLKVCSAEGCFWEGINVIDQVISDPDMTEHRSRLLFLAGEMSAGLYEYDKASGYYARSLACPIRTKDQHVATVTKLGFCNLYRQDFKQAEEWSRWAIKLWSHSWEAWKNLGVSLEHQNQIEEAFLAYFKAVFLSRGRMVPVMHMVRLSQRHPAVLPDVSTMQPAVYREYSIFPIFPNQDLPVIPQYN
jgi:tetratricopeptide (TPR) repeat protein